MKTISKLIIILLVFQFMPLTPAWPLDIKTRDEYLLDVRGDDGDIYRNRVSLYKKLDPLGMELSLFEETQWNFQTSEWEKLMLGMKAKKNIGKYLRISQSAQVISGQILDYVKSSNINSNSADTTTSVALRFPLIKNFSLSAFEEYSINLQEFRAEYAETGAEIAYSPNELLSLGIGWRHTDRIHDFDSDYVSASVSLTF